MLNEIIKAGEFVLEECTIHTCSGGKLNLLELPYVISDISVEEDIEQTTILGSITFLDSGNASSNGPIIGQETLTLKMQTTGIDNENSIIDFSKHSLMVFSLRTNVPIGDAMKVSQISFCSFEMMEDRRMRLSQSFEGEYYKIVEKIFKDILKSKKKLWLEETVGKKKIIAPNISPFDVIKLAMHQGVNESREPTFYFWETTKGYNFRTLESMYSTGETRGPKFRYIERAQPGGIHTRGGAPNIMAELSSILSWQILSGADTLVNYQVGVYASKLIEHDIFNKTYTEYKYDYLNPKIVETHIPASSSGETGNPIYSATPINDKGDTISTTKDMTFLFPVSIKDVSTKKDAHHSSPYGKSNFAAPTARDWHQRRVSMRQQIQENGGGGPTIRIVVNGNTVLNAGDMIYIDLYSKTVDPKKRDKFDVIYNGPFLIKKLRHNFSTDGMTHKMEITAIKDSLPVPLPATGVKPSKSGSSGIIDPIDSGWV